MKFSSTLPQTHEQLLSKILAVFTADPRILGIGASGSYASDSMDKYSDLDLVIAINPEDFDSVMAERFTLIDQVEGQVAAFTGEHVGEPRLVIAIYAPDAIHVDFKFVSLPDAATRVDDTKVLWERDGQLSRIFETAKPHYPQPDPQWIEDRFWIWVHYGATKIAVGMNACCSRSIHSWSASFVIHRKSSYSHSVESSGSVFSSTRRTISVDPT